MNFRAQVTAAMAGLLVVAPVAAQAQTRAASPVDQAESLENHPWIPLVVGLVLAIVILVVAFDDDAVSP